ncbi:MAG: gliding motility-associated C-terminal domain-containing protein [Bacteroidota bacterium]
MIGAGSSVGANFIYEWTTPDGVILSGSNTLTPQIAAAGTYQIVVTDISNGCTASDMVEVTQDTTTPIADAGASSDLTCSISQIELDGNGSSTGTGVSYLWTTLNGNILANETTLNPIINLAGTYELIVTGSNGCTSSDLVTINENIAEPTAAIIAPNSLNCNSPTVTLVGAGSSAGSNFSYFWTSQNGIIVGGETTLNPEVAAAGTYQLIVTDNDNGCTSEATVNVVEDFTTPTADAGTAANLSCSTSQILLDGSSSSTGAGFTYLWSTQDGNILSDETTLNPTVNLAGTYLLVVTAPNGCSSISAVTVNGSFAEPVASAVSATPLSCATNQVSLDGGGSTTGANITYLWTTSNGNILSGETTLNPIVDEVGTYELLVTNTDNDCTATSVVEVSEDVAPPTANATAPMPLTCTETTVLLDGVGSSTGGNFTYLWTTQNGSIVGGSTTLTPEVSEAGTYEILVTNTDNGCTQTASIEVVIDGDVPLSNAGIAEDLTCEVLQLTLDGEGSTGANFTYLWTTSDGNILADETTLNPLINQVGTYQLLVTDTDNGCSATSTVTVNENIEVSTLQIDSIPNLTCTTTEVELSLNNTSTSGNFTYSWTTPNGNIVSGENTLTPTVSQIGEYILETTNLTNGCTSTVAVTVDIDDQVPIADAGSVSEVNCNNLEVALDGSGSATGANFTYTWTTQDGNIIADETTLNPIVSIAGNYQLLVTDTDNGCTAVADVFVEEDFVEPTVNAGNQQTLSCTQTVLQLNGNGSSIGNNFEYLWTTPNGNITSGENTLTPEINSPGEYVLEIVNTENGCAASASVIIAQDSDVPVADAGTDDLLNCNITSLVLDGTNSSSGVAFSYEWTTQNGNIVFGENTTNPAINAAGIYQLVVTNNTNGCTSLSTVAITLDDVPPVSEAGSAQFLSCTNNSLTLDGSGSSAGADYTYQWITQDGNILSGGNTLTPEINATGTYELVVTSLINGCTTSDVVEIAQDSSLPIADAGAGFAITCEVIEGSLDATASVVNNDITFAWTTQDGNIVSGENTLTPFVNQAGIYQLTLTNTVNGCTAVSSVTIANNDSEPTAEAGITQELNCFDESVILNGATASTSPSLIYLWTTPNGSILSGENTLNPEVDGAGLYELLITNTATGCTSVDQVTITENQEAPIADSGPSFELNCTQPSATLDGSGSSTGINFIYQWTTPNGNIVSGENTLTPEVNLPGNYDLTVTNLANGCTEIQSVTITENIDLPTADAGTAEELTCVVTDLTLNAGNSSVGAEFEYQWTTTDGNILTGATTLNPAINDPGTYILLVTNTTNNCTATDEITVAEEVATPVADAGAQGLLTCGVTETQLDGSNSSAGTDFIYTWTTNDGIILFGENTTAPTIGGTGTYELIVTNAITGCTSNDFVDVLLDGNIPDAIATPDGVLNCNETTITLNGTNSSAGANFTYQWTTLNGIIIAGETTTTPTVSSVGEYTLVVTDNDNGCTNSTTITVEDDFEAPTVNIDQTGATALDCNTSSIILDGSASQPLGNLAYAWTTTNGNIISGSNAPNPEVDDAGEYTLAVTNLTNGCTATTSITITQDLAVPVVNIAMPFVLTCDLTETDLDANNSSTGTNFSYQWITNTGNIVAGGNTLTPTINQSGTYQLTIIDLTNSCENTSTITVTENTTPPVAEAGIADILDCQITEVTLDGSGSSLGNNITYEWGTPSGNIISGINSTAPTVNAAGSYSIIVTDTQNGCTASDVVLVEEDENVPSDILFSLTLPDCFGDLGAINIQTVAGGTAPYLYSIDGVNFYSGSNFAVESGNYTLYAQDASGCELQTDLEIPTPPVVSVFVNPEVTIELGENYQIETVTNIPSSEIAGVEWLPNFRLSCTDCLNPIAEGLKEATTYTVTVTNIYGCKTSASITIQVDRARNIFIPNVFTPNNDGQNDVFMIFAGKMDQIKTVHTFQIYDRWGEQVYRQDDFMPMDPVYGWDGTLRGKTLNPQVFVYYADIEFIDGYRERFEGDVALKR